MTIHDRRLQRHPPPTVTIHQDHENVHFLPQHPNSKMTTSLHEIISDRVGREKAGLGLRGVFSKPQPMNIPSS